MRNVSQTFHVQGTGTWVSINPFLYIPCEIVILQRAFRPLFNVTSKSFILCTIRHALNSVDTKIQEIDAYVLLLFMQAKLIIQVHVFN